MSPFPGPGATVRISTGGGANPQWSATSHELLFLGGGRIMSVSYTAADPFVPAEPRPWVPQDAMSVVGFVLHPDGTRAAVALVDAEARRAEMYARDKIVFWSGFFDYLKKTVVVKK